MPCFDLHFDYLRGNLYLHTNAIPWLQFLREGGGGQQLKQRIKGNQMEYKQQLETDKEVRYILEDISTEAPRQLEE